MKVIFLDIDGVLTTEITKWSYFDLICVERLKKILDATDAKLVLSSSWRLGFQDWRDKKKVCGKDVIPVLRELLQDNGIEGNLLVDKTPLDAFVNKSRGQEIQDYLALNREVTSFVILDDDNDMEPHINKLVRTSWGDGLLDEHVEQAIKILNME